VGRLVGGAECGGRTAGAGGPVPGRPRVVAMRPYSTINVAAYFGQLCVGGLML